jgi:tight adherence protein B
MIFEVPLLLLLACLCLGGLVLTYMQIARADERAKRLRRRFAATLARYGGAVDEDAFTPMRVRAAAPQRSVEARFAALLGADPARQDLYPVKWWLVPLIALVPARLAALPLDYLINPWGWLAIPPACWLICNRFFHYFHRKRATVLFIQFPDALAMIVRAVRVGIPISEAIRAVGKEAAAPTAEEFARLSDEVAIGAPLDQALRAMAERNEVAEYRFFATALSLQSQTGGGISETLENLADVIRKRVAARARGKALAAEARASATALAVLPFLAMGSLWVMNPSYMNILFMTDAGNEILAGGAVLLAVGIFVMRMVIQKSLS